MYLTHNGTKAEGLGSREEALRALAREPFDLLVVGGGINGTGAARDAVRRGLKVALIDKEDFGYGTTGRSTRLVHGGLRYLEMYDFGLVRESLRERKLLLRNAPHLVRPLRFLFPVYAGTVPRWKVRAGLLLYDVFAADAATPRHRWLGREATLAEEPALAPEGLLGAFAYYDSQVADVERLCVENALDAVAHGAVVVNHAEAVEFILEDGRVTGSRVRDRIGDRTIAVRARATFNATGPWLSMFDVAKEAREGSRLRMTKGIHLVVPKSVNTALILRAPKDDRTFFAIPWHDRTLVGTTDTDYTGDLDDVAAERDDVEYLVEAARRFLPKAPLGDVAYATAGVRSLLNVEGVSESEVSRKHYLLDHGRIDGVPGLFTLVGGKITPYRGVAAEVVDRVMRHLRLPRVASDTRDARLPGGRVTPADLEGEAVAAAALVGIGADAARHIVALYGSRYTEVLDLAGRDAALARPLCPHGPDVLAQVVHAVEREMAATAADVLLRRTTAGWRACEARDEALDLVVETMAARLTWPAPRREAERRAYLAEVAKRHRHEVPVVQG